MSVPAVVLLACLLAGTLEASAWRAWASRWADRDASPGFSVAAVTVRVAGSVAAGSAAAWWWMSPAAVLAGAAAGWLAVLAVQADAATGRIPREACWVSLAAGSAGVAAGTVTGGVREAGWAAFAAAVVLVGGLLLLVAVVTRGGLGSGDVRMMVAFTPLAAWCGAVPLLLGVAAAGLLQLGARAWWRARGRTVTHAPFAFALVAGLLVAVAAAGSLRSPFPWSACVEWLSCVP